MHISRKGAKNAKITTCFYKNLNELCAFERKKFLSAKNTVAWNK
jgi:hypothetical protein